MDVCSLPVAEIYLYWTERRRKGQIPLVDDIDPADFPYHQPGVLMVKVTWRPLDFVYESIGRREVQARGFDPTGKRVAEHWFGSVNQQIALSNYRHAAGNAEVVYDWSTFRTKHGIDAIDESIFLPLTSNGERVDKIMVYSHYNDLWSRWQPKLPASLEPAFLLDGLPE